MINQFGADKIVVGLDAKDGMVATQGWVKTSGTSAIDLAQSLVSRGLRWIVHTDVSTDGAMKGPNLEAQQEIAQAVPSCNIIASGGVSCSEDIIKLRELSGECTNIEGVIVGKALYEKTIDISSII
jgi:phosphoribosylformimino-5-aminoimidazole carboxamide ribotide isomerase